MTMATVMDLREIETIIAELEDLSKNPEIYVEQQPENSEKFKLLTQKLFYFTVAANPLTNLTSKSLPKLLIKGFDEEQIWQQIEIQNSCAIPYFSEVVSSIDPKSVSFNLSCKQAEIAGKFSDHDSSAEEEHAFDDGDSNTTPELGKAAKKKLKEEEYVFDDDSDSSADIFEVTDNKLKEKFDFDHDAQDDGDNDSCVEMPESNDQAYEQYPFDDDSNSSVERVKPVKKKTASRRKSLYKSEVDDQFFKLANLEEFLKVEDLKEERQIEDDSSEEDNIDLFQDIPSENDAFDEESDQEEERIKKSSKNLMYGDFFDAPESGDENDSGSEHAKKRMKVEEESDNDSEEEIQDKETVNASEMKEIPPNSLDTKSSQKTAFELEQEIIKKKIGEYEKSMLEPLPWHLTGEVAASSRPIDSLIHHEADFESNVKQDHVTDNTLNESVENFIKKQIGNKAFQDVERKFKPTEEVIQYKKEVALDQTKSKKSLAEVYEEDYLKKQSKQEEGEDPKHIEIKKLMDSLFPELQALFSHMPKPAIPEIKVVSNLPAVTVEEVAPTSVSDATLLAPEEVKQKSGLVKGQTERTDTDRKRERRKKKLLQKVKGKKMKDKLEAQKANPSARKTKLEKLEILKKLKQHRNTKIANVSEGAKIKSSKDFFSRLQDTVDSKIKTNTPNPKKKKAK